MSVDQPRKDYADIKPKWDRLRDVTGGRDAVLLAGDKYCPNLPGADSDGNAAYRKRGNFYNATGRTIKGLNGAIFQEAPEIEIAESIKPMLADITLTNVPFETFAGDIGKEIFTTGRAGVLVDMPQPLDPAKPTTDGAVAAAPTDMRPYCVSYKAEEIINWRTTRRGGDEILTMVVLCEKVELDTDDDPFTCKIVDQYRVLKLVNGKAITQIWRKDTTLEGGHKYTQTPEGDVPLMRRGEQLTFLPFVFFGALQNGPSLEEPPLLDLCDVNLGHWRNSVDHEYGLHLVALPTPWVAGAKGSGDGAMKMGPSVVWELDTTGKAGMLEFAGTGLGAIVVAMEEKKKQMATLGARLLESSPQTQETAAAVRLRHTGETASLKTIAQSLEMGFTQLLQMCVWWQTTDATPADSEANVELNKEYIDVRATPQEMQVALTALQAGEMSFETWYNLLLTGGWAREGIDADQELKDIAKRKIDVTPPPIDPSLSPNG
jgi:hypothetical protein